MQHKKVSQPQTVNACTLISVAIIDVILQAQRLDDELLKKIEASHIRFQQLYKQDFTGAHDGAGVLEDEAYRKYFSQRFAKPTNVELSEPTQKIDLAELLNNRDSLSLIEFLTFNGDTIEAVEQAAKQNFPRANIDWETITLEELKKLLPTQDKPELRDQILDVINRLNNQGVTIRAEGHTLSLVKRGSVYLSYDSVTGILSSTDSPVEMADHIIKKCNSNRAKSAILTTFTPLPALNQKASATGQSERVEKDENISPERIQAFINTRQSFAGDTELWLQSNDSIVSAIICLAGIDNKIQWDKVTVADLCLLLKIKPVNPAPITQPLLPQERIITSGGNKAKLNNIRKQLDILALKILALKKDNYNDAADAAEKIHDTIEVLLNRYENNLINLKQFKDDAKTTIDSFSPKLDQFQGWELKKIGAILVNLLALICSIGITYIATGSFSLFTVKTESEETVSELQDALNELDSSSVRSSNGAAQ